MPKRIVQVDVRKRPEEQPVPLHNRWHPDIPPVATVRPGESFRVECLDWTGGQIHDDDSADDVRTADLTLVHYLSGPFAVEGAEPGDLLVVDVLDLGPLPGNEWGFTGIFSRENGGGFLTDLFPHARKAVWQLDGIWATSRHLPGVRFAGIAHPGLMGVAPSAKLLGYWNRREADLIATAPDRVPALAFPPFPGTALLGSVRGAERDRMAKEAARTVPPRENGGNVDIKNLGRGSRVFFPVFVKGANLSVGDLHFSQGDGEITFCGAIEMAGFIDLHVDVIKDGMDRYKAEAPLFMPGPVEPRYPDQIAFEGISLDDAGRQLYLDARQAYRRACLSAIRYLEQFGYSPEQAYVLLGTAPVEGRISGIVDVPNACCTVYLPTGMFDFDIRPGAAGPQAARRGALARTR
jgi:formamidase